MIVLIDNFDSFTHILADYFRRTGVTVQIVRNDVSLEEVKSLEFGALVISPGPETPALAGKLMEIIHHYHDKLPILGVCLGHQAIGTYFGAQLCKGIKPMHGKISVVRQTQYHETFSGLPGAFKVTRYHSLVLKNLPKELSILLETNEGEIMAIAHQSLPLLGLQFHPEAHLTEHGLEIIGNWVRCFCRGEAKEMVQ
ncbi:MAG: aminodeoxychorismate/anthranilate synthase component II [Cyclobacteriaceae bacterium]